MATRAQVDRPLAVVDAVNTASPVTWWVHPDHLNRPVMMTDAAKAQVWQAVWKPFGEAQSITGPAALDTRFPGQWFQIESGLHYNWHRHYDPTTGRYTQPDPLGFVDGPGMYGYVGGSTSALVDLDGQRIGPTIPLRPDLKPIPPAPNPLPIPKPKFWPEPKVPPYSPIPDGPSGARYIECGPYEIRIDNDPHKKKHAHWYRRKKKEGCIKVDGSPCDGSGPPPNRVRKCLEDDGFFNFIRQEACYVQ